MIELYDFQKRRLDETKDLNKVAYFWEMGTGKTFVGSEKMMQLGAKVNLVICQKSKVKDWIEHFTDNYFDYIVYDGTKKECLQRFFNYPYNEKQILVINYELAFRRPELLKLKDFTLMLDESSMIQNENAKRTRFILKMQPENIILLSGTPCAGKYEKLYAQLKLLGWEISKTAYWNSFIQTYTFENQGFPIKIVSGYKNVERLKRKMHEYGCRFLKTEDVIDLPEQVFTDVKVDPLPAYKKFQKNRIVQVEDVELVGDTTLTKMLYERQLCGQYNKNKLQAFEDLIESTEDRLIVFYNFTQELYKIEDICIKHDKPLSIVNGKTHDLSLYEEYENSVTVIQYQAGAMGLNLQKANKIIYFTPPLSSELFEQSKKRIHRLGQNASCFYYNLVTTGSVEEKIYKTLAMRKDYTERLFENGEC